MRERIKQEFDDEDDDLIGSSESGEPSISGSETDEKVHLRDILNSAENNSSQGLSQDEVDLLLAAVTNADSGAGLLEISPELERPADISGADKKPLFINPLRERAERLLLRPRSSNQEIRELLDSLDQEAQAKATEAPDLIESSENFANKQLTALGGGAEVEPIKMELQEARNELLGTTSDAQDEFDRVAQEAANHVAKNNLEDEPVPSVVLDLDKFVAEEKVPAKGDSEPAESEAYKLFKELHGIDEVDEQPIANPEIIPIDPEMSDLDLGGFDTSKEVESPVDGTKVEIPLRSQKNVGIFNRLGTEAKRIYTDLTFKSQGRREINRGQKMLEKSEDKAYALNKDLAKSDDKIEELKDKLTNIDEMLGKFGEGLKIKEKRAIYKSRQDLDKKIKSEEKTKESLALKLEIEETNKVKLQEGIESAMGRLDLAINERIKPYKEEVAKLEINRGSLVEEKENFEAIVGDFESRLAGLRDQMANLDEVNLPVKAKKSFQAVLNRKIKDIESALKISQKNISKLEDNIVRVNGRLNKEDARLGKWEGIRGDLKETAQKKEEKAREEISRGFVPRERAESAEEIEDVREFSAGDYLDKWNSISKNDSMLLDKKLIMASKGELTLKKLEGIIKTTRFRGLSERQLKKKIKEKTDLLRAHFGIH